MACVCFYLLQHVILKVRLNTPDNQKHMQLEQVLWFLSWKWKPASQSVKLVMYLTYIRPMLEHANWSHFKLGYLTKIRKCKESVKVQSNLVFPNRLYWQNFMPPWIACINPMLKTGEADSLSCCWKAARISVTDHLCSERKWGALTISLIFCMSLDRKWNKNVYLCKPQNPNILKILRSHIKFLRYKQ